MSSPAFTNEHPIAGATRCSRPWPFSRRRSYEFRSAKLIRAHMFYPYKIGAAVSCPGRYKESSMRDKACEYLSAPPKHCSQQFRGFLKTRFPFPRSVLPCAAPRRALSARRSRLHNPNGRRRRALMLLGNWMTNRLTTILVFVVSKQRSARATHTNSIRWTTHLLSRKSRWARAYGTATNFTHTGAPTSRVCPVGVSLPVFLSMRNTTILSEFWLPAIRNEPVGSMPNPRGTLPSVEV